MLVSCVMPTRSDRREFLGQALKYWGRQTYPEKELILVDDVGSSAPELPSGVRRIEMPKETTVGMKLNAGIQVANGNFIQKMDDDDYYAPAFLHTMVKGISSNPVPEHTIAGMNCALVFLTHKDELKFTGYGMFMGNTLLFSRKLWEQGQFRDIPNREDYWFLRDHNGVNTQRIADPELMIVVRHGRGHLWQTYGGISTDAFFETRHRYQKVLSEVIPAEDLPFYRKLVAERSHP